MGAQVFVSFAEGESASAAFRKAVDQASYDYGHAGYTGTIAEKHNFRMIDEKDYPNIEGKNMAEIEGELYDLAANSEGKFWDDKWGDAACIKVGEQDYYFFGWASS